MKHYKCVLKKAAEINYKKGINTIDEDSNIYKTLKVLFILSFIWFARGKRRRIRRWNVGFTYGYGRGVYQVSWNYKALLQFAKTLTLANININITKNNLITLFLYIIKQLTFYFYLI